jgi:hypothetical protein
MSAETQLTVKEICLSRLEFGKFCATPNGPVEKEGGTAEHRVLGKSEDFPTVLGPVCNPSTIRILNGDGESMPADCPHATVLVPFVSPKNDLYPIFSRVRQRAEDGESGLERKYTMARYLVAHDSATPPLALFSGMNEPLTGLSRAEAGSISNVFATLELATEYRLSGVARSFVKEALMYVMSGIPLSLSGGATETDFFGCVTALWFMLPPFLRPLLSAGWGVGTSLSGRLALTYTESHSPTCATFAPQTGTWNVPTQLLTWVDQDTSRLVDYYPERRQLGESFWQILYGDADDIEFRTFEDASRARAFEGAARVRDLKWIEEPPDIALSLLPDFHNQGLIRTFRTPGLKARDLVMGSALTEWLSEPLPNEAVRPTINADEFTYKLSREAAFAGILEAFANPLQRERAEQALWESLANHSAIFAKQLKENEREGRLRGRLIETIRQKDVPQLLELLVQTTRDEDVGPFVSDIEVTLASLLDQSVAPDPELLRQHNILAGLRVMSPAYEQCLVRNGLHLAELLLNERGEIEDPVYTRLLEFVDKSALQSIRRLSGLLEPSQRDEATIGGLSDNDRQSFIAVLYPLWMKTSGDIAERRERLFKWLLLLKPVNSEVPLWRLALGKPLVSSRDKLLIMAEIEGLKVPVSLEEQVAVLVLENWSDFSQSARTNRTAWERITRQFPPHLEKILLEDLRQLRRGKVSAAIQNAAEKCLPTEPEVNRLIEFWGAFPNFAGTADVLWRWAAADRGLLPEPGVSGLVFHLSRLQWPSEGFGSELTLNQRNLFIQLAESAKASDRFHQHAFELWSEDLLNWRLMVLLRLIRRVDFTPTSKQLASLIPYRGELRQHLNQAGVYAKTREKFSLATLDFHELSYKSDARYWDPDYTKNNLWALFRGVPLEGQRPASLTRALYAFSNATGIERIQEEAAMGCRYLDAYLSTGDFEGALGKVMIECLVPLLSRSGWSFDDIERFLTEGYDATHRNPGFSLWRRSDNSRMVRISPPALQDLLETVVESYSSRRDMKSDFNRSFTRER